MQKVLNSDCDFTQLSPIDFEPEDKKYRKSFRNNQTKSGSNIGRKSFIVLHLYCSKKVIEKMCFQGL